MGVQRKISGRRRLARLPVVAASLALLPALIGCSSSSSSSVEYATNAFPSQSLVDLLKESREGQPSAQSPEAPPAAAANAPVVPPPDAALPAQPAPAAAPPPPKTAAATLPAPPPAVPTAREEADPVAAAFPSTSLIDLLTNSRQPAQ